MKPAGIAQLEGRCGYICAWGDNDVNRSERYLVALIDLDGVRPCVVMYSGYYTVLAAYDWDANRCHKLATFVGCVSDNGTKWYFGPDRVQSGVIVRCYTFPWY